MPVVRFQKVSFNRTYCRGDLPFGLCWQSRIGPAGKRVSFVIADMAYRCIKIEISFATERKSEV